MGHLHGFEIPTSSEMSDGRQNPDRGPKIDLFALSLPAFYLALRRVKRINKISKYSNAM